MMKMRLFLALPLIGLLAACGGGGDEGDNNPPTGAMATTLSYQDPVGGYDGADSTTWRLVRDDSSSKDALVLNLVGPDNLEVRGVGFNLKGGEGVSFARFADGKYARDTGVFQLYGTNRDFEFMAGTPADPVLFASGLMKNNVLTTGIFQKDRTNQPKTASLPLVQIKLQLNKAAGLKNGDVIPLSVIKARMVPADIGGMGFVLDYETVAKAKMADIAVRTGTLIAK